MGSTVSGNAARVAGIHSRVRYEDRQTALGVSHHPQAGRVRIWDVSKDSYKISGGCECLGRVEHRCEIGNGVCRDRFCIVRFYGANRIGDNLFANCVLALDARTGKRIWHFQGIHHDVWDLDFPAARAW